MNGFQMHRHLLDHPEGLRNSALAEAAAVLNFLSKSSVTFRGKRFQRVTSAAVT